MHTLIRTNSDNPQFIELVKYLDADLAEKDGDEHSFYNQFNKITQIKYVIIASENGQAVGCGAIKGYGTDTMEVKRMYTLPAYRGKGIAGNILSALETWAVELNFKKCILETGRRQPDAIGLYQKHGYHTIPNYGQYAGIENSMCFEKIL